MATPILDPTAVHRPRNVDWKRAAALLYGDWGTSKAYVIGLAFVAAGFASLPIILAVCVLTAVVAYNYIIVCAHFPDGGGVYSAARQQSRFLASTGALLLMANFIVTAALSGWAAVSYLGVPSKYAPVATMGLILVVGVDQLFRPETQRQRLHLAGDSGRDHGGADHAPERAASEHRTIWSRATRISGSTWVAFVGVILALSGVEAIANITGVMKIDPGLDAGASESHAHGDEGDRAGRDRGGASARRCSAGRCSRCRGTSCRELASHKEDMLRFLAEVYGAMAGGLAVGQVLSIIVGIVFGLLLLSAVNTAIVALIGVVYMMAQDGEMPRPTGPAQSPRRAVHPAHRRGRHSHRRPRGDERFRGPGRPLRDRRGRRDRGESWLLHVQQTARPSLVPAPHHGR